MTLHDDCSIEHLALGMMGCTLPKVEWTHAGHFAAALWLLRNRPELTKPQEIRGLITRYNEATGTKNSDTSGYHNTITLASMRAAAFYLERYGLHAPLSSVLSALMASNCGHSEWLLEHWERTTLLSVEARREWVNPDLAVLPF